MSGVGLAPETTTSVVSPQHANPKRTDDASTLAKDLLGVTLVPETAVQSTPDVTSSPPVDQEVPTDSHLTPFGFSLDPPSDFALVDALVEASPETKTSVVPPQHANSKRTDDAITLAKDLLGITLVPETTVQSAPDVTTSPPVDQEVPTDSHLTPFGFSLDPPSDFALVGALVEASPNPLGYRMRSP